MLLPPFLCKKRSNDLDQLLDIFLIDLSDITNTEGIQVSQLSGIDRVAAFLDVLIKLDLIDSEDMEEVSEFLDKLLAQEKYEGRRESNVKYVVE